jgi:AAA15 family ATPase/GTPase
MSQTSKNSKKHQRPQNAIVSIAVSGFKSIGDEQNIEIRPLTLLAGANSSGKSSMMQPILLLKQTLEAQYDPGPLLLNGPNAKFTSARQFLSLINSQRNRFRFSLEVALSTGTTSKVGFLMDAKTKKANLEYNIIQEGNNRIAINSSTKKTDIFDYLINRSDNAAYSKFISQLKSTVDSDLEISRDRCFFDVAFQQKQRMNESRTFAMRLLSPGEEVGRYIQEMIHLPGLRGNPERSYPVTAIGDRFPGTFENYVASLLAKWGTESSGRLQEIGKDLDHIGLTWKVEAKPIDDTQVEIRVGRLKRSKVGGAHDLVNVADVGFGVSQTLPVVVALHAARPGQLVYIEQPEIHLHPRAQVAMGQLLANAANRGVQVVVETHSSLLLLAVQALVAEGVLDSSLVKLNWFLRDDNDGSTQIQPADLDEAGRFGDWPEDFGFVALEAEDRYLTAAEAQMTKE